MQRRTLCWQESLQEATAKLKSIKCQHQEQCAELLEEKGALLVALDEATIAQREEEQGGYHRPTEYPSPDPHQREQGSSRGYRQATREAREVGQRGRTSPKEGASSQDGDQPSLHGGRGVQAMDYL